LNKPVMSVLGKQLNKTVGDICPVTGLFGIVLKNSSLI
jgi:hypothetical protein